MGLTIFGLTGGTYQMRYILPALPALAVLTAKALPKKLGDWSLSALVLIGVYSIIIGIFNSFVWLAADLVVYP